MILTLSIILFFLMLLVGGNRGVDSFFALCKTVLVMGANIYMLAWGMPAIPTTFLMCVLYISIVLYVQNGKNAKMHAAAVSVIVVLLFVFAAAGPVLMLAGNSGYNEIEQYEEISMYLSGDLAVSMSAVALSAVVLGLLGAIMDTAVAITTAVNEVYVNQNQLSTKELFQSGLTVGKDILGTTVNTLFFAGLGECIMLAVLFMKNEDSFIEILNSKALFQEVSGLLIGVTGCILIIPVGSLICAVFLTISEEKSVKNESLLRNCYKLCKKVLKSVKNMLK